jgi:hypothetical protein
MKVTVDISPSELDEICTYTGESKKGPAIRKMVIDALMLRRREKLTQKFISGQWGAAFAGYEAARAAERRKESRQATRWKP